MENKPSTKSNTVTKKVSNKLPLYFFELHQSGLPNLSYRIFLVLSL